MKAADADGGPQVRRFSAAGPRVGLGVLVLQPLHRDVRVYLGGGERGVAEHLLHRPEVCACVEEVRREAVPQLVRR